jgi:NADP-dependent 3-hydroxy acid dehydrogenase YdfG
MNNPKVAMELPNRISDPAIAQAMRSSYEVALPENAFAHVVAFTISRPQEMVVNKILFKSVRQAS